MKQRNFSFLAIGLLMVLAASGVFATAQVEFILDGTIVATCTDETGCDGATGVPGEVVATFVNGSVGVTVNTGSTKPVITNPVMDLGDQTTSLAAGHTLVIAFTETGFLASGGFTIDYQGNFTCSACSTSATAYYDTTNAAFGVTAGSPAGVGTNPLTGTQIATTGKISTTPFSSTITGLGSSVTPYSLTEVMTFSNTARTGTAFLSSDFKLSQTPEPTSVLLLGSLVGIVAFAFRKKFSGNVA